MAKDGGDRTSGDSTSGESNSGERVRGQVGDGGRAASSGKVRRRSHAAVGRMAARNLADGEIAFPLVAADPALGRLAAGSERVAGVGASASLTPAAGSARRSGFEAASLLPPRPHADRHGGAASVAIPASVEQRIRRGFFAEAAWCSPRYGVTVEDLLAHVAAARSHHRLHVLRQIQHVPDLAVAAACGSGSERAWGDAAEWFEPVLVRGCRLRLDAIDAVVFARRFLAEVRANSLRRRIDAGDRGVAMQDFLGNRPLRTWLVDRLLGRLERVTRLDELHHEDRLAAGARTRAAAALRLVD